MKKTKRNHFAVMACVGIDMKIKHTEKDLAAKIINYLSDMRWDIYQEVQMQSFDKRADIVALKGDITWVIETKMGAGLDVIQQAHRWQFFANYVSIAVPRHLRSRTAHFAQVVCRKFDIGMIECDMQNDRYNVRQLVAPKLYRTTYKKLRRVLNDNHKTFAEAGNADGKFWSPFKQTCSDIAREVKRTPGMTMKELIGKVDHHYSSDATARGSIIQWIRAGSIKGVTLDESVWPMRIYPEGYEIPVKPEQGRMM